jgi:hypothetical protein
VREEAMEATKILNDAWAGKTLKSLEFGNERITDSGDKVNLVSYKILRVSLGFNDSREDAGILLYLEGIDDPIFVYDNEEVTVE